MTETCTRQNKTTIWAWPFSTEEELRADLEEYGRYQDGTLIRHYGDPDDRGDGEAPPEVLMEAAQKRSEIDACMEILKHTYPFYWRLLDLYYRCEANAEVKGWIKVGRRVGLRGVKCPDLVRCTMRSIGDEPEDNRRERPSCQAMLALSCLWDRDTFNDQITQGIKRLFVVHQRRHESNKRRHHA